MLTEKWLRNPTNKTALEMDAVAVFFLEEDIENTT
jgi:hypothetical protein